MTTATTDRDKPDFSKYTNSPEFNAFIDRLGIAFDNNHLSFTEEKWARIMICLREAMGIKEE